MDRGKLFQEIRELREEIASLQARIQKLEEGALGNGVLLEDWLKRRGLSLYRPGLLLNPWPPFPLSPERQGPFYQMLKRYSFRLFLRDVIQHQDSLQLRDLTHFCSEPVASRYLDFLEGLGLVKRLDDSRFQRAGEPIPRFGLILEWFLAEVFRREYASPSLYEVKLAHTRSGGDYDVLALWEKRLIYLEVKSSPPKGIEIVQVAAFLQRLEELMPDLAFFLVDTHLRMKDKIAPLFEEALAQRLGERAQERYPVKRLVHEIFHVNDWLFILNSKRGIVPNLRTCLRHVLQLEWKRLGRSLRDEQP